MKILSINIESPIRTGVQAVMDKQRIEKAAFGHREMDPVPLIGAV